MRLVEAPPVQSTGLAAVKRTIRPNIGSEAVRLFIVFCPNISLENLTDDTLG